MLNNFVRGFKMYCKNLQPIINGNFVNINGVNIHAIIKALI